MLWIVNTLSIVAGVWLAVRQIGPRLPEGFAYGLIGASTFVVGTVLRWWSIYYLGRHFTVDVAISQDHEVVDSGPYRFVRHPSYVGLLLQFLGLSLTFGFVLSVAVVTIPPVVTLLYRIRVEEAALCQGLGDAYVAYMERTKRLIPWLY